MASFITTYAATKVKIPDFDNSCITQLPQFFQDVLLQGTNGSLTKKMLKNNVPLDGVKSVVFFLVDGFGYEQWQEYRSELNALQKFEKDGYISEIDSVFPSSTPVALTTLNGNGATPDSHGLIDWWLYIEEINKIIATLPFTPMGNNEADALLSENVSPTILFSRETTYEYFEERGIRTRVFLDENYVESSYTKVAYRGSSIVPYVDITSLFLALKDQLEIDKGKLAYNFVYWGGIDRAGHAHGLDSEEYKRAVISYFDALYDFLDATSKDKETLFVLSADHGQINVDPQETIYLDTINGLFDSFRTDSNGKPILRWGGPREIFLSIKNGLQEKTLALLHEAIGEHVELLESREALNLGLFGHTIERHSTLDSRIGDIIILPKNNKTVWYHHPGEEPFNLRGHHGGLTRNELKVPLAILR